MNTLPNESLPLVLPEVDRLYETTNWLKNVSSTPGEERRKLVTELRRQSDICRKNTTAQVTDFSVPYGPPANFSHGIEAFDWFPPRNLNIECFRVIVYIHGGFWRALNLPESSHWATSITDKGGIFVALAYRLAPWESIRTMPKRLCEGMRKIYGHTKERIRQETGISSPNIIFTVVGHSAGAQLAIEMVATAIEDQQMDTCWLNVTKNLVLISGLYDLRPILRTTKNQSLGLKSVAEAYSVSPIRLFCDTKQSCASYVLSLRWLIAWAEYDSPAFKTQSSMMVSLLEDFFMKHTDASNATNGLVETFCCKNEDHFTSIETLHFGEDKSELLMKILEFTDLK